MHIPVLLQEVLDGLQPHTGDVVVDATVGGGGHAVALSEKIGANGTLVGIDEDENALLDAEKKLKDAPCRVCLQNFNFREIDKALRRCAVDAADIILYDLGWSSTQVKESGRGFSFRSNEPLLMTLRAHTSKDALTAYEIVNYWDEKRIVEILEEYGEERFARQIGRAITIAREKKPIGYANELAEIVESTVQGGFKKRSIHPATKTFQALRIAVNDELNALQEGLTKGLSCLKVGGRMGVISFHSLEDRITKRFFKEQHALGVLSILTKKPITPSGVEIAHNRSARSAKLRIAQKRI